MNTKELISKLLCYHGGDMARRIKAELQYAYRLSETVDTHSEQLIYDAAQMLLAAATRDGCITDSAARECERILLPMGDIAKSLQVFCVSHAHIDMNWMWGFNETVAITLDTFRTVTKLLEEYPQFTFSQSQTSTYRIVEQYDPALFAKIQKYVKEGRWEVTASTWVEADKNMSDSESLVRQILHTKQYFKEKFQMDEDSLLLDFEPDTFGHSRFLPEVLASGGVKYYYHCRGNELVEGRDIYYWDVPSGARVLVYREPDWYNGAICPEFLENIPSLCQRNHVKSLMKVYGVGDHGGGPTRRDLEMILKIADWPIAPTVKFSTYGEYFRQLEKEAPTAEFPIWYDEVNFVFTGCYSSQSKIKAANRNAERRLFEAEAATVVANMFVGAEPYDYSSAWENTLFNQFHDILPGSGVNATRDYALGLAQQIQGYAYAGKSRALLRIAEQIDTSSFVDREDGNTTSEGAGVGFHGDRNLNSSMCGFGQTQMASRGSGDTRIYHIFNPTAYDREEVVELTLWDYLQDAVAAAVYCVDGNGQPVEIEWLDSGEYWMHTWQKVLLRISVPAMGYNTVVFKKQKGILSLRKLTIEPRREYYHANVLENQWIRAEFDDCMQLMRVVDKQTGEERISGPSGYFTLTWQNHKCKTVFPGNAWVEGYTVREENINTQGKIFITQKPQGSLRQRICYHISFGRSILKVCVFLDKNARLLEYQAECDWQESFDPNNGIPALRFRLPLGKDAVSYLYKVPLGFVEREAHHHDVPVIGCGAAKLAGSENAGVALLSDVCYAYRGEKNMLGLTMLRSSQDPDPYPERGLSAFRIGVAFCSPDPNTLARMEAAFSNVLYAWSNTAHSGYLPLKNSLFRVDNDAVTVCAVKQPRHDDDGFVVRIYDHSGCGGDVCLSCCNPIRSAERMDILERRVAQMVVDGHQLKLSLKPNELVTLHIW